MIKLLRRFSQLNKQQIINSNYEQLVQRIAHNYNLKQYKNQSGLCLLQMHHQFKLFNPGDWVLDVGAGKNYAWTDLALKLTQNQQSTNKVISNDILDLRKNRQNNIFIRGDIAHQPVQTKIALQLQNHNLNTILVDVSPPYTGNLNGDGRSIMNSISSVFDIAQNFLNKGGNMVCKVLQSEAEPILNESFDIYFNEKYKYVPTIMRKASPVCFYVLKGFMMSENLYALTDFLKQYKGSPDKKIKLVEKYRGKYSWDPEKIIKKHIVDEIIRMKKEGRPDKDIIKAFVSDPYAKAERTLKLLQQSEQAFKDRNMILHYKILNQLSEGELYKNAEQMPSTAQEFYQKVIDTMEKIVKQDKEKKAQRKNKISRSPLKDNEVYMKAEDKVKQRQEVQKQYLQGDLQGRYSDKQSKQQIELQINKIQKVHPEVLKLMNEIQQASKDTSQKTIEQILQANKHRQEQLSVESLRNIQQAVEESIKNMTSSQIEEQRRLERDVYRRDLNEERVEKADRWINQRRSKRKRPIF